MRHPKFPVRFVIVTALHAAAFCQTRTSLAPQPPMGWNSWDSYGLSVNEAEFKENVQWLATNLKQFGWRYAVVDEGWYLNNPGAKAGSFEFTMDAQGRYLPAPNRFSDARGEAGFKPLAEYVHGLGLQFGIHIIRGIPRKAVDRNLPIANSAFRAADAADKSDTCTWNGDNYGVRYTPAGQEYYDSLAKLYASWGLDFVKVDCIAANPYKGDEIRMIREALDRSGRKIVLSLSPGPAPLDKASELKEEAQMWRISNDVWDRWSHDSKTNFPQSIVEQFPLTASWAQFAGAGHWPDADMLPIGYLGPRPGEGQARNTRLTHDEQQTLLTLWSISRSPLFMGGNLTKMDDFTKTLLTNREVMAVDQYSSGGHAVLTEAGKAIWVARDPAGRAAYVALFNLSNARQTIEYPLQTLGLGTAVSLRDVWGQRDLEKTDHLRATLSPHASALYRLK